MLTRRENESIRFLSPEGVSIWTHIEKLNEKSIQLITDAPGFVPVNRREHFDWKASKGEVTWKEGEEKRRRVSSELQICESLVIGGQSDIRNNIQCLMDAFESDGVRLGIAAPKEVQVLRGEACIKILKQALEQLKIDLGQRRQVMKHLLPEHAIEHNFHITTQEEIRAAATPDSSLVQRVEEEMFAIRQESVLQGA